MNTFKSFFCFIVGFFLGISGTYFYLEGLWFRALMVFVLLFFNFDLRVISKWLFLIFIIGFLFGAWRFLAVSALSPDNVRNYLGEVEVFGKIMEYPDVRSDGVRYVVGPDALMVGEMRREVSGNILVVGDKYPLFEFGDCLKINGKLQLPISSGEFDYENYLAKDFIYALVYRPLIYKVDCQSVTYSDHLLFFLYDLKRDFEKRLNLIFSDPYGAFMAGLILGSRKGIDQELMSNFNLTGLTHIVAVSGFNITLVIVFVSNLLFFLSQKWRIVFSAFFVILFILLVGATAAVLRAAIMGVIGLLALFYGRPYFVTNALIISAFFLVLFSPLVLIYDIGFQLSFLATAGLIYFSPILEPYLAWLPKRLLIRESLVMTLSAQVFALPVILFNFGTFSLVSPLANLLVLPLIPFAMLFGFAAVLTSLLNFQLAVFCGFLGFMILKLVIFWVNLFASFKWAVIDLENFGFWFALFYYLLLWRFLSRQ